MSFEPMLCASMMSARGERMIGEIKYSTRRKDILRNLRPDSFQSIMEFFSR